MKKLVLLTGMVALVAGCSITGTKTATASVGQRYFDLLNKFGQADVTAQEFEAVLSADVKKVVNSKVVCESRDQVMKQMNGLKVTYGAHTVNLLEVVTGSDAHVNVVRFEVTWKDNTTEVIIAIVKTNSAGLIEEINEVFGTKAAYEWQS